MSVGELPEAPVRKVKYPYALGRESRHASSPVRMKLASINTVCIWVLLFVFLTCTNPAVGYSVLTHEAIVDAAWDVSIRPLLLQRFPNATPEELKTAHAYAYGGAIIQDLGYYPHGSHFFSDLTHYCRTGDFVLALLRDSQDLNGYAFAIGALSHYAADIAGHRIGINPSVPILYPKLESKYGKFVTYEQDPLAHIKAEFGFDVLEAARQPDGPPHRSSTVLVGRLIGPFRGGPGCGCGWRAHTTQETPSTVSTPSM